MPTMSGYGRVYRAKLASSDTKFYQAWLWQTGVSDAPADVTLSRDASCKVVWGRKGSDIYVPILASHAEVNGWHITDELESLIGARTGDWRLEIVSGTSHAAIDGDTYDRYWLGQVLADVYSDSTMSGPSEVNVQAVDGLGTLKEVPYYDTTTTPGERIAYTGVETLLVILRRALGKLGYNLPVRSAIAWRPSEWTTGEDPLAHLEVNNLAFYSVDGTAMSAYGVIEEITRRIGVRLCQWEGSWWVVSRELMSGTAYTYHKYTDAGVADGTDTGGAGLDAANGSRLSGTRSFRPAFSSVAVQQNHGPVPPLVDEGNFSLDFPETTIQYKGRFTVTVPPVYTSGSWTYNATAEAIEADRDLVLRLSGTKGHKQQIVTDPNYVHAVASGFHGTSTDPYTVKARVVGGLLVDEDAVPIGQSYAERTGNSVFTGQILAFTGAAKIRHYEGLGGGAYNTYWSLTIDGTDYYLKSDGTWGLTNDIVVQAQFLRPPGSTYGENGIPLETWQEFTIVSAASPADGDVTLRLYGSSDRGVPNVNDLDVGPVYWDNVAVVVATAEGEQLAAQRTELFLLDGDGAPLPDPAREDIQVMIGEGPAQELPTTMFYDSVRAVDWDSALLTSDRDLDVLHAETVLRSHSSPLSVRQEKYRGLALSPIAPLTVASTAHIAQALEIDLYHQEADGEWVERKWDSTSTATSEATTVDDDALYIPRPSTSGIAGVSAIGASGGDTILKGRVTVTDPDGNGGESIVSPGVTIDDTNVQLTPDWMDTLENWGISARTTTTFTVKASTTAGGDVEFTWWVTGTLTSFFGQWHFNEARHSHQFLTIGF